tara:strand:- start:55 stop:465 length:411 start_codon:yes stop_codon:yes gene_type:complete
MSIKYTKRIELITSSQLDGFFVGWVNHPNPETHLQILRNSFAVWIALDGERCVGFINAISDKVFYSFIPLLEVLPSYQGQGIGKELTRRMLISLKKMYAIDLCCDKKNVPFYKKIGFNECRAMVKRNYENQGGSVD